MAEASLVLIAPPTSTSRPRQTAISLPMSLDIKICGLSTPETIAAAL